MASTPRFRLFWLIEAGKMKKIEKNKNQITKQLYGGVSIKNEKKPTAAKRKLSKMAASLMETNVIVTQLQR